jgi:UTP--glucose-1-phosphate uridylyltransferase
MHRIKKAVIPVAGLGTRFLPATKVVPKELLPIVDKPALQYVVEEAVESGIREIIFISNPAKAVIEEHFRSDTVRDELLCKQACPEALGDLYKLNNRIKITTVFQKEPLGLGHAVLCSKDAVGNDWFMVTLPDMLMDSKVPCTAQLIESHARCGCGVISVSHAPKEMIPHYGIVDIGKGKKTGGLNKIEALVEKPKLEDAPSNLFISGRYLLPPEIFKYLENTRPGKGGELQITDALIELVGKEGLYAHEFDGVLHDTGDKLGYLKANIYYAMKNEAFKRELREYVTGHFETGR